MQTKKVIFQKHDKIFERDINTLFSFSILYHDKYCLSDFVRQQEYTVVDAIFRTFSKVSLLKVNGKEYLVVDNDYRGAAVLDDFLSSQNDRMNKVTAEMIFEAIIDHSNGFAVKERLCDIYCNYNYLIGISTE